MPPNAERSVRVRMPVLVRVWMRVVGGHGAGDDQLRLADALQPGQLRRQFLQPLGRAVLQDLLVKPGDIVVAGQIVARLDSTLTDAGALNVPKG